MAVKMPHPRINPRVKGEYVKAGVSSWLKLADILRAEQAGPDFQFVFKAGSHMRDVHGPSFVYRGSDKAAVMSSLRGRGIPVQE